MRRSPVIPPVKDPYWPADGLCPQAYNPRMLITTPSGGRSQSQIDQPEREPTSREVPEADPLNLICGEIAGSIRRAWGRGPVSASAHWAGPDILIVLLQDGHTSQEKALRAAGEVDLVRRGRRLLAEILEEDLKALVRRATGREVITVLSANRLEPDISAEVFLLRSESVRGPELPSASRHARARARETQEQARAVRAEAAQARRKLQTLRDPPGGASPD